MAVAADIVGQGTLTGPGTQDVIRTGAGTENHSVLFRNYSGGTVVLELWINSVTDAKKVGEVTLLTKESCVLETDLGSGDVIYAEADTATAIGWTDVMVTLS